jgi:hypothetical protein
VFIILLDEPTLLVFPSEESVIHDLEPPDAETIVRAVFDENAMPYDVEWLRPNVQRKWFFGIGAVDFGEYRLKPSGDPDPAALIRLLEEHGDHVHPPSDREQLGSLVKHLREL